MGRRNCGWGLIQERCHESVRRRWVCIEQLTEKSTRFTDATCTSQLGASDLLVEEGMEWSHGGRTNLGAVYLWRRDRWLRAVG